MQFQKIIEIIIISCIILCIIAIIYLLAKYILWYIYYDQFTNSGQYLVLKKYNDTEKAQQLLTAIDNSLLKLIESYNLKYKYLDTIHNLTKKQRLLLYIKKQLNKTYSSKSLQENFPTTPGHEVSYNANKGQIISICLRNYNDPTKFHDLNDLIFVAIHELSHSCNESYGHDTKFWKVFRILLEVASEYNIYTHINYQENKSNYCSMHITYNPVFDKSLDDIYYFK